MSFLKGATGGLFSSRLTSLQTGLKDGLSTISDVAAATASAATASTRVREIWHGAFVGTLGLWHGPVVYGQIVVLRARLRRRRFTLPVERPGRWHLSVWMPPTALMAVWWRVRRRSG